MTNKTSVISYPEYVIVDIETTGFSAEQCAVIQIAAQKIRMGEKAEAFATYVDPGSPIPGHITQLTGITDGDVAGAPDIREAMEKFLEFAGNLPLAGHNDSFDFRFLNYNACSSLGRQMNNVCIDTLKLARELVSDCADYKLGTLTEYFHISSEGHHRADQDVRMTYELIQALSRLSKDYRSLYADAIRECADRGSVLRGKKVSVKTKLPRVNSRFLECVLEDSGCTVREALYASTEVLIVNDRACEKIRGGEELNEFYESWMERARARLKEGTLILYGESGLIDLLGLPASGRKYRQGAYSHVSAKEIAASTDEFDEDHPLYGKKIVFTGALDRYDRRKAMQYVADVGGECQDNIRKDTDYLVLGDNSFCKAVKEGKSSKVRKAEEMIGRGLKIQIIPESTFYQLLKNDGEPKCEGESPAEKADFEERAERGEQVNSNEQAERGEQVNSAEQAERGEQADSSEQDGGLNAKINAICREVIEQMGLPEQGVYLLSYRSRKGEKAGSETSRSICINEPAYPAAPSFSGKKPPGKSAIVMNIPSQDQDEVELVVRKSQFSQVPPDERAVIKQVKDDVFSHVIYPIKSPELLTYIKKNIVYCVENYSSSVSFGCCSRYEECSELKVCVHENQLYAKGCSYGKNLRQGKIFYGKNKTV